ncbi:MAG: methyltransferase domain-containing protein [Alphaproteobacteria bacterium]|nr:methyltransferase domain-containing protein [Alphaproteobacteria bacterium]
MTDRPITKHSWAGPKPTLDAGQTFLSEFMDEAAVSFRPLPGPDGLAPVEGSPEADDGDWLLEYYAYSDIDIHGVEARLAAFLEALGLDWGVVRREGSETLPETNWVQYSLEGLGLVEVGRFVLYGTHDEGKAPSSDSIISIRIDANQAFGTGHHPTTFGCLSMLDRFAGAPPTRALDLGCGSGVLAIAAAKLWGIHIHGVDIDPTSVDIARENARLNGVRDLTSFDVADGPMHAAVLGVAPFDFVFANILAGPLVEFAPGMGEIMAAGGRVLLAGLMAEQENGVRDAYSAAGFKLINRLPPATPVGDPAHPPQHPVWPILLFVKV